MQPAMGRVGFICAVGLALGGCYTPAHNVRKERNVATVAQRKVEVPTYRSDLAVDGDALVLSLHRDVECRDVIDVDVEYEKVTELRELNWPKIPFFAGLGVGAIVSGAGLLGMATSFDGDTDTEQLVVATGGGIAGSALLVGLIHAIAPETKTERVALPVRREERVVMKEPGCKAGVVAEERVELETRSGRTVGFTTDARGRIRMKLARLSHEVLLEGELGLLRIAYGDGTTEHRVSVPTALLPTLARAAARTKSPIEERALTVDDSRLVAAGENGLRAGHCRDALKTLRRVSETAEQNAHYLRTYAAALECAGKRTWALRAYAALHRLHPSEEIEPKLDQLVKPAPVAVKAGAPRQGFLGLFAGGSTQKRTQPAPIPVAAAPRETNPLKSAVLAVFPIRFEGRRRLSEVERHGLFELYVATLGEEGLRMVPPGEVKRLLAEQKVESFRACYDTGCQIELGKAMAASVAVQTSVLPLGDTCLVTSTAFDLETETSVRTAKRKTECATGAIGDALEAVAADLGA